MGASAAVERARLLISQQRYTMAQDLLHQELTRESDNAMVHSLLAFCLSQNRDQLKEATRVAEQGVFLAPDSPFSHYILALIWKDRNQTDKALESIAESLALDPTDATLHGLKAQLLSKQSDWKGALRSAEEGLTFDPEDETCGTIRTVALERLGKVVDARQQAEESLRQNPDSTWAHSSQGWARLQQGDYQGAQRSFAEALRLSPSNEMARDGMIQALNSTNFVYRWFYRLMIQMSRLDSRVQWALIIGLWMGMRFLNGLARDNPALKPWVLPISLLYLLLVMMTWIMAPLFNTMLRFHPYGKHLLTAKEKWASNLIAGTLGISLALAATIGVVQGAWIDALLPLLTGLYLTIPIVIPFNCDASWARMVGIFVAVIFGILYFAINIPLVFGVFAEALFPVFMIGLLVYCFAGQALMSAEPKY